MAKECVQSSPQPRFSPQPTERRRFLTPRRSTSRKREKEYESDPHRLAQRQRQIMYGENTPGYRNFIRLLETDPALLQGCLPLKPSIVQRCSKRSWDGQVRKWRRALHMYDFVDFGEDEQESIKVRDALVEQTKNPLFITPKKVPATDGQEVQVTSIPKTNPPLAAGEVRLPSDFDVVHCERVRYAFEDLMLIADSPLIATNIKLPESLAWLDKRVDLEDDVEDDLTDGGIQAGTPHKAYTPLYARSSPSSSTPGPAPTPQRAEQLTPGESGSVSRFAPQPVTPSSSGSQGSTLRTPQREGRPLTRSGGAPQSQAQPQQAAQQTPPAAQLRTPVRGSLFAPPSVPAAPEVAAVGAAPPSGMALSPLDFLARHAVQEIRTVRPVPVVPVVPQLFPAGEAVPAPHFFTTPTRPGIPSAGCGFRPVGHVPLATAQAAAAQ